VNTRLRPDRKEIKDEWIEIVIGQPLDKKIQADGRIKCWGKIIDDQGKERYLRVILLEDGETIHNAFFDRRFRGESNANSIL
jgi:hypothetical protein